MGHMTCDTWHMTHDMWQVTHGGRWTFPQTSLCIENIFMYGNQTVSFWYANGEHVFSNHDSIITSNYKWNVFE